MFRVNKNMHVAVFGMHSDYACFHTFNMDILYVCAVPGGRLLGDLQQTTKLYMCKHVQTAGKKGALEFIPGDMSHRCICLQASEQA
jgi:hypothetical protein